MFALRSGQIRRPAARPGVLRSAERFVLPRWMRRPVRLIARLGNGDFTAPRYGATIATALLFAATGLYGTYVAGTMPAAAQAVTARTGFAVDQIRVFGHRETSEIDILEKIQLDGWTSLIGFSADEARARISELPWVEMATVRKVYPDILEVRIEERKAFAIWQHDQALSLIGQKGNVIAPFTGAAHHARLPLVVGAGAAGDAAAFVAEIASYPELAKRVRGYIQVAGRRWDLRLDNGLTIKLPEGDVDAALADVLQMDKESALFGRDIVAVDMRIADRVVVQLSPDAATARLAALDTKAKPKKKQPGKKA